jgi:small subunit ribosomal protein S19
MKKEFHLRGKTQAELEAMSEDELLAIMPSRARRTLKRGFTDPQMKLINQIRQAKKSNDKRKIVKTHVRDMLILPEMVGVKLGVYTGKEFSEFEVKTEMIGHYVSEFVLSRKPVKHSSPGVGATRSSLFVPVK